MFPISQKYACFWGHAVCFGSCICLFIEVKVLFCDRQAVNWQTMHIPQVCQIFYHPSVSLQEESWCNPNWMCLWGFKELYLSMFGLRCSWGNTGNVLATHSLHYYRLHNVIPLFMRSLTWQSLGGKCEASRVRSPCISTFPIRTALKGKWNLSPVHIQYNNLWNIRKYAQSEWPARYQNRWASLLYEQKQNQGKRLR